ncbi:MAG: acetyl-CoA carboxylase, carboxyltransferase subunit beta [Elusimicrobiota bacterium]
MVEEGVPKGLFEKCPKCDYPVYSKELEENLWVCPKCDYYFRLPFYKRLKILIDEGSFKEYDKDLTTADPLKFRDRLNYPDRVEKYKKKTSMKEAVVSGTAKIGSIDVVICILDFYFMGGSMGSVVGEKVCRAVDRAIKKRYPLILVSSSGGARMQEGILSLMQMAKTAASIAKLGREKIPYFSIMCDPTSGGVSASFAMLGDVNISEPKSLIAFAGPRVIKQTIKQDLPRGFQRAEFLLEHGMLDMVVERDELRSTLVILLNLFTSEQRKKSQK